MNLFLPICATIAVLGVLSAMRYRPRIIRHRELMQMREQRAIAREMATQTLVSQQPAEKKTKPYNWQFGYAMMQRLKPEEETFREILEAMTDYVTCDIHDRLRRMERAKHNLQDVLRIYVAASNVDSAESQNIVRCKELIQDLEDEMSMMKTTHTKESHG